MVAVYIDCQLHRLFTGLEDKSLGMTEQLHPNFRGRGPGLNKKERAEHKCCHTLLLNTMWPASLLPPRLPHMTEGVPLQLCPHPHPQAAFVTCVFTTRLAPNTVIQE